MTPGSAAETAPGARLNRSTVTVIGASSVGTIFEWYDFFLYGSLATFITKNFFSGVNETTGYIFALLAFAAGFAVRPFGALVFGRLGDLWGRKNTFLITMLLMGLSTFVVGCLPSYAQIGIASPVLLILSRLVQGLALGGEYGGAATYVAEHAPANRRGFYTSFIQTTATGGLLLSLLVILFTRGQLGEPVFAAWGWRLPFLVSVMLLGVSLWIRLQLSESPLFEQMIAEGKGSKKPIAESFGNWTNLKQVLIALFGLSAGEAVVWYTGQFYALFFLEKVLKVDGPLTNQLIAVALVIGTPFFVIFGWLSDKVGRKPIILLGCALAALTFQPIFRALTVAANPALAQAAATNPVTVVADPKDCSLQFDPVGKTTFTKSCDVAKSYLAKAGVPYANRAGPAGAVATIEVGGKAVPSFRGEQLDKASFSTQAKAWEASTGASLKAAGYPAKADPVRMNKPLVVGLLLLLVIYATMTYAPLAAILVEMFPTRVRYTSMSVPYHIGNGWFGGFLPTTAFAMVAATGNIYYGLWYPIVIAAVTVVVGLLFVKETKGRVLEA